MPRVRLKKDEVLKTSFRADPTTLAAIESLAIPRIQEVVFVADFQCARCQERVAEIMSKMKGETQSVMISVLDKKVTLTCRNSSTYYSTNDAAYANMKSPSSGWSITRLFRISCN